MTQTVKLTSKQKEVIDAITAQKNQLLDQYKNALAILNDKEGIVLSLVIESASITGEVTKVDLNDDTLTFEIKEATKAKKDKVKPVKSE